MLPSATRLKEVIPSALMDWLIPIPELAQKHGVTTTEELCSALSQFLVETAGFTRFTENLNYSVSGLCRMWKDHFCENPEAPEAERLPNKHAYTYAHQPQALANRVYASRYGNDSEASGDGWKYRGRGAPMLTFKDNYKAIGDMIKQPLVERPEYLLIPHIGVEVGFAYWKYRGMDKHDDDASAKAETKLLTGASTALIQRQTWLDELREALC